MDRIERALQLSAKGHEHFRQQYRELLVAQAVQSDLITENARQIAALAKRMDAESTVRKETDARLDARVDQLVSAIGQLIASIPPTSLTKPPA